MKSRKMIIAVLLFVAVAVSSATFAYWASTVQDPADDTATGTVTIGEGDTVSTDLTVADVGGSGTLVPVGFADSNATPATVDNEDKDFTVQWTGTGAEGATGTLNVSVDSVSIDGLSETQINDMFTIDVTATPTITAGTDLTYTVNVEFTNEPANETEYTAVANGSLVVTLNFNVVAD